MPIVPMSLSNLINGTTESAAYTYDLQSRLATSNQTTNGASAQRKFSYDRWGNRTTVYDYLIPPGSPPPPIQSVNLVQSSGIPSNRIASVTQGGTTLNYTYDNNGNVTNDGVYSYQYDAENRQVSVDSGSTASYSYDSMNRRIKKVVGAAITHYTWVGHQALAEYNGSTGVSTRLNYFAGSKMITTFAGGQQQLILSDRLSARLSLDWQGNVVGRQGHLPFGEELGVSGTPDKHRFTSYEQDAETGTNYAVNRFDNQSVGRFTAVDMKATSARKAMPQTWNRYSYTANDPVNMKDPWGLDFFDSNPFDLGPCDPFGPDVIIDGFAIIPKEIFCYNFPIPTPFIPSPEETPPLPCEINVGFDGEFKKSSLTSASEGRNPDLGTALGPKISSMGPGWWLYFFEIEIVFPGGAGNRNDWTFKQVLKFKWKFKLRNGQEFMDSQTVDPDVITRSHKGWEKESYYWVDAPGSPQKHEGQDIVETSLELIITVSATHKDSRRSCSRTFTLLLTIGEGGNSWVADRSF